MSEFLSMGGYGAYVWPAYAAFFVVAVRRMAASIIDAGGRKQ